MRLHQYSPVSLPSSIVTEIMENEIIPTPQRLTETNRRRRIGLNLEVHVHVCIINVPVTNAIAKVIGFF